MATTHFECNECEAAFAIKHTLDKNYYQVLHCPFCGSELDNENFDVDDNVDE